VAKALAWGPTYYPGYCRALSIRVPKQALSGDLRYVFFDVNSIGEINRMCGGGLIVQLDSRLNLKTRARGTKA
jgi:hypothetical protein